jgi:small-conductance mechanosensitive channel
VLADPAPMVLCKAFADNGINLELGFWISDPEAGTGNVCSDISLAIWKAFSSGGIEIPFPQRDIRIVQGSVSA